MFLLLNLFQKQGWEACQPPEGVCQVRPAAAMAESLKGAQKTGWCVWQGGGGGGAVPVSRAGHGDSWVLQPQLSCRELRGEMLSQGFSS